MSIPLPKAARPQLLMLAGTKAGCGQIVVGDLTYCVKREEFPLDKCRTMRHLNLKRYSISEAARLLKVDRRTLQRWIRDQRVPEPTTQMIANVQVKFWTERGFQKLSEHKAREYWHKRKTPHESEP